MTANPQGFLRKNILFHKDSLYAWPSDYADAILTLKQVPYSPTKKHFFNARPLSASGEEIIENQTENWSFEIFVKSALYFFLHDKVSRRKQTQEPLLSKYDWIVIVPLLLHSHLNKEIILFLENYYVVPYDFKILAIHFGLTRLYLFNQLVMTEESLNEFLIFLKIDENSRKILVKSSYQDRNFKKLTDFLFVFNSSLNQEFLLSEGLQNYNFDDKSEGFFKCLEDKDKLLADLFQLQIESLESFNIIDLFDSSEFVKSKGADIQFFSFYEFLLGPSYTSMNLDFLEIFKLFEKFLYESKNKSILLAEISLERTSEFFQFLEEFYLAYEPTISKILFKQLKRINKLSKKSIPFDVLWKGGLLAFLALISLLGLKPTNSERKPLLLPQTGCYASIASSFKYGVKVNQAYNEPSLRRSLEVVAASQSQESNQVFVQARPTPRATVSYTVQKGGRGAPVFKQKKLQTAISREVKVFVPENSSFFEKMPPTECLELLIEDISNKFPNCLVNIRQKYGTINGIYQKLNEITISGTVSQYGRLDKLKKEVIKDTICTEGVIVLTGFEKLHRDHVSNKKLREINQITEDRGACVVVEKFIHDKMSEKRNYLAPLGLGYLPGAGGSLTVLDHFDEQDQKIIENFKNDLEVCEGLEKINFSIKDLADSYAKAHKIERNLLLDKMEEMGSSGKAINETTHLATSQDIYLNGKLAEQMDSLADRTQNFPKQNIKQLEETVNQLLQEGQFQREHTYAIKKIVPEGTTAFQNIETRERRVIHSAKELVLHVEGLGAAVDDDLKNTFFAKKSSNLLSPEEAYQESKEIHGLGDYTSTRIAVPSVGARRHVPKYPDLK